VSGGRTCFGKPKSTFEMKSARSTREWLPSKTRCGGDESGGKETDWGSGLMGKRIPGDILLWEEAKVHKIYSDISD